MRILGLQKPRRRPPVLTPREVRLIVRHAHGRLHSAPAFPCQAAAWTPRLKSTKGILGFWGDCSVLEVKIWSFCGPKSLRESFHLLLLWVPFKMSENDSLNRSFSIDSQIAPPLKEDNVSDIEGTVCSSRQPHHITNLKRRAV
jgi:hypothetical protein